MSDKPIWEAGVMNADVTSDIHTACRAENEQLVRRIVRLETIVARLCDEAARGQGSLGKPFWEFADLIRTEHAD